MVIGFESGLQAYTGVSAGVEHEKATAATSTARSEASCSAAVNEGARAPNGKTTLGIRSPSRTTARRPTRLPPPTACKRPETPSSYASLPHVSLSPRKLVDTVHPSLTALLPCHLLRRPLPSPPPALPSPPCATPTPFIATDDFPAHFIHALAALIKIIVRREERALELRAGPSPAPLVVARRASRRSTARSSPRRFEVERAVLPPPSSVPARARAAGHGPLCGRSAAKQILQSKSAAVFAPDWANAAALAGAARCPGAELTLTFRAASGDALHPGQLDDTRVDAWSTLITLTPPPPKPPQKAFLQSSVT